MAIYGLGTALAAGLEGFDRGQQAIDADRMRHEQLAAAETSNRLNRATADQTIGSIESANLFKDAFKTNLEKFTDPDFSEQTNFSRAGLEAAKQTKSPELISKYLENYSNSVKQDVFSRQVDLINQIQNSGGQADPSQVNLLAKKAGVPIEIQSIGPDGIVARGPNGVRSFTLQGYMNEAARAINPNTAYGNVQAQIQGQQAGQVAEADAKRRFLEKQQDQEFELKKIRLQKSLEDEIKEKDRELRAEIEKGKSANQSAILDIREKMMGLQEKLGLIREQGAASRAGVSDFPEPGMARMEKDIAYRYHASGEDPATLISSLRAQKLDDDEIAAILKAAGVGGPRKNQSGAPSASPYGLTE